MYIHTNVWKNYNTYILYFVNKRLYIPLNFRPKSKEKNDKRSNYICIESEPKHKTYLAAREIFTTEKTFNEVLDMLYIVFRKLILESHVVPKEDFEKIFKNILEIKSFSDNLLMDLKQRIENWDVKTSKVADIFVKIGPFIK